MLLQIFFSAALYILYPGMYLLGGFMYLVTALVVRCDISRAAEQCPTRDDARIHSREDLKHD